MKVNPAGLGVERYVDSPLFLEIILALLAIFFGAYAWQKMQQLSPNVFASLALVAAVILCIVAMAVQKRRTFLFDTTARTLTWTSRGLRERAAGTTDFKDVRITLDPSFNNGYTSYRIMVSTPAGSWPLSSGYDANQGRIKAQAARLCALLGQTADRILADSVVQLTNDN